MTLDNPFTTPIYAITDPFLLPGERLFAGVEEALKAGVTVIQYRDKNASPEERLERASILVDICNRYQAKLIVNDSVSIALESQAHGVHLGQEDGSLKEAREILGPHAIIGATCHDQIELAQRACDNGADYVVFGRFFHSSTKPQAKPAHLDVLQHAKHSLPVPVVAIGGITPDNMAPLVQHQADALAVCQSVFGVADITAACQRFLLCWKQLHV